MVSMLARKCASLHSQHSLLRTLNLCFKSLSTTIPDNKDDEAAVSSPSVPPSECSSSLHISPFFSQFNHPTSGFDIELVDRDAWGISSGVAQAWRAASEASSADKQATSEDQRQNEVEGELDFEELDNMRIRGNLFFKLERSSKEFEEYNLEFHQKKSNKKKNNQNEENKAKTENKAKATSNVTPKDQKVPKVRELTRSNSVIEPRMDETKDVSPLNKRQRNPTFNQLTVAHSISKDIKFDLANSTKSKTTCAAVGAILAQRALADDIHDVIYTPRKGNRVEGKLQIVLHSIMNNGINVKVKIKQRQKKSFRHI
ncbi:uncharacterized protein LOC130741394 isoform X2 [Lotus japonicus]|uniref:uncharacterized protein LOC130741394 isoform X2 n=1 Tax=Lotus japonicus TaxID=34305 RepID=UPI00258BC8B2|nr:uncharacterized protein LOC130741394 isoform X2 [Lotus japonicus]